MLNTIRYGFPWLLLAPVLCLLSCPAQGQVNSTYNWNAASGLTPDQVEPTFPLFVSGGASAPFLESNLLKISTGQDGQNVYYMQVEPAVETEQDFSIEFRMRLVSGSTSTNLRGPVTVFITLANFRGTLLVIDVDKVFFTASSGTTGTIATVDTNEALHTYRVQHDGLGKFTLFYDESELLQASAFADPANHGSLKRIGWGEGSSYAFGASEWEFFNHNAIDPLFKDSFEDPVEP